MRWRLGTVELGKRRKQARLRWYEHVRRRKEGNVCKKVLNMADLGRKTN